MTARVALTYQDYAALPDDGKRYEIHDGELSVMAAPTPDHQIVIGNPTTGTTDRTTKRDLYARYGVPYLWLVDPRARVIEAYVLRAGNYDLSVRASGTRPVDLPPFTDPGLGLVPSSLWP